MVVTSRRKEGIGSDEQFLANGPEIPIRTFHHLFPFPNGHYAVS
jgi:hypothetical protein